jgi:hypothetical protein
LCFVSNSFYWYQEVLAGRRLQVKQVKEGENEKKLNEIEGGLRSVV